MSELAPEGVCFHEDGHFYAVTRDEDGTHSPDFDRRLKSVDGEWQLAEPDYPRHNDIHAGQILAVEAD